MANQKIGNGLQLNVRMTKRIDSKDTLINPYKMDMVMPSDKDSGFMDALEVLILYRW